MKILLITISLFLLTATEKTCKKKKENTNAASCYKGKLEIKAACMNYTISVVEGDAKDLVAPAWTNESTGKTYENVFELGSKCNFPNTINEDDEFYFVIDSSAAQNCAVCMLYYPVPPKKLSIKIIEEPCGE